MPETEKIFTQSVALLFKLNLQRKTNFKKNLMFVKNGERLASAQTHYWFSGYGYWIAVFCRRYPFESNNCN